MWGKCFAAYCNSNYLEPPPPLTPPPPGGTGTWPKKKASEILGAKENFSGYTRTAAVLVLPLCGANPTPPLMGANSPPTTLGGGGSRGGSR